MHEVGAEGAVRRAGHRHDRVGAGRTTVGSGEAVGAAGSIKAPAGTRVIDGMGKTPNPIKPITGARALALAAVQFNKKRT